MLPLRCGTPAFGSALERAAAATHPRKFSSLVVCGARPRYPRVWKTDKRIGTVSKSHKLVKCSQQSRMELSQLRSSSFATLRPVSSPCSRHELPSRSFFPPQPPPPSKEDRMRSRAMRTRQEWVRDWVRSNDTLVRGLPILVGGASLLAVLLNRAVSGIAAVSDASSSQSRADILTLALSVTDILAGLVWLSIRPKSISPVVPRGVECKRVDPDVSNSALHELLWTWDSLTAATCCKSLVVVYGGICILQIGTAAGSPEDGNAVNVDAQKFIQGSLYTSATESKKQFYLANLALYPGRTEVSFLPANTQALILQPIADKGIAVIGGDTIRGFTNLDQAWIAMVADKLDVTLSKSIREFIK